MLNTMGDVKKAEEEAVLLKQAGRAQRVLYILMLLFMLLPLVVAWLAGAFRV